MQRGVKKPAPANAAGLAFRYAAGVTIAYILAVTKVVVIMTALGRETTGAAHAMFDGAHSGVIVAVVVAAIVTAAAGSVSNIWPTLGWFVPEQVPTPPQARSAIGIGRRQSLLLVTTWIASGAGVVLANRDSAFAVAALTAPAVFFGATAAVCTALLLTMRTLRPITAVGRPGKILAGANPVLRDRNRVGHECRIQSMGVSRRGGAARSGRGHPDLGARVGNLATTQRLLGPYLSCRGIVES
jgi:hypothetical protein